jgi:hypothetical protein
MGKNTDILFDLIDIWAKQNQFYSVVGSVKSIDGRTCIVTPGDGSPDLIDVALEADYEDSESKGFYIVPAIGSNVIVTFKSKDYGYLSAYTAIDSIVAKQGEWIFNDGSNEGLVKINDLTSKLNNLVSEFNALKDIFNNHIHTTTATISASAVPGVISPTLTPGVSASNFNKSDYENEDVKH